MSTTFAEIIKDINHIAVSGLSHSIALAAHDYAEKELALYAQALSNCHPDQHAFFSAIVVGAKAKEEALSLLCQKLK